MRISLIVATAACFTASIAFAQNETFDLDFTAGEGANQASETVTGTLTLAAGTTGAVAYNEILGYTLSSTLGDPVAFSISGSGAGGFGASMFSVQGNDLLFTPLPFVPDTPCSSCDANGLQEAQFGNPYTEGTVYFAGPGFDGYPGDHGGDGYVGEPGGMSVGGHAVDGSSIGEGDWAIPTDTILGSDEPPGSAQPAPEISATGAGAALTLLSGMLAILRGGRHRARFRCREGALGPLP